jgi:hypothetical protein
LRDSKQTKVVAGALLAERAGDIALNRQVAKRPLSSVIVSRDENGLLILGRNAGVASAAVEAYLRSRQPGADAGSLVNLHASPVADCR